MRESVPWSVRVMLVDDDPHVLRAVERLLTHAGIDVIVQQGGFGLSRAVATSRPDLIVLDLSMPGLPGDWAMRAYRALGQPWYHDTPIVVFSGLPDEEIDNRAHEIGAFGWVRKSDAGALLPMIKRALAEHEIQRWTEETG